MVHQIKYDPGLKMGEALHMYFANYHFKDGGYYSKWFTIKAGPIYIPLPNIKARVDAVKIHDLHHVLTEYEADFKGEAAIGAWEIAAGCGKHYVAWILNFGSFLIGMFCYPRALLSAFLRGKKCTHSLYHSKSSYDDLIQKSVGELRAAINVNGDIKNSFQDYLAFVWCCIVCLLYHFLVVWILVEFTIKIVSFLF